MPQPTEVEISVDELKLALDGPNPPQLVDVREPWECDIAFLPGSIRIPMGTLPRHVAELDPTRPTVTICHHGIRSLNSALFLKSQGFADVRNLAGGIDVWAVRIDPSMRRY